MAVTTTSNVMTAGNLGEYITRMAIRQYESRLFFAKLGKNVTLPIGNNTYSFPTVDESVAMWTLTEGTTPSEWSFTLTNVTVTLGQYGWFVKLSDILLTDAPVEVITEAAFEAWRQAAEKVDAVIQDAIDGGTNVLYGGDATARAEIVAADTLTSALVAKSVNLLKANDAPTYDGGYYITVVHPHVFHDLQQESGTGTFIDLHKYDTPEALFAGEAGSMWGTRFLVSSNVQFYADGGATTNDAYPTYVLAKNSYGVVTSGWLQTIVKGLGDGEDPLNQIATVGAKVRLGAAILKQAGIYRIETGSSLGANS